MFTAPILLSSQLFSSTQTPTPSPPSPAAKAASAILLSAANERQLFLLGQLHGDFSRLQELTVRLEKERVTLEKLDQQCIGLTTRISTYREGIAECETVLSHTKAAADIHRHALNKVSGRGKKTHRDKLAELNVLKAQKNTEWQQKKKQLVRAESDLIPLQKHYVIQEQLVKNLCLEISRLSSSLVSLQKQCDELQDEISGL